MIYLLIPRRVYRTHSVYHMRSIYHKSGRIYIIGGFAAPIAGGEKKGGLCSQSPPCTPKAYWGVRLLTQSVSFGYHPSEKLGFNRIAPLSPSSMDFINTALCAVYHNRAKRWLYHICGSKYIIFLKRNISFHGSAVTLKYSG